MDPAISNWIDKAEADYWGALDLRRSRRTSNRDLVCYHCQQAVEKYLKARLVAAGISFPKTHDLVLLLKLVTAVEPLWAAVAGPLSVLSAYAVEFRYPGRSATAAEAREAVATAQRLRQMALDAMAVKPSKAAKKTRSR